MRPERLRVDVVDGERDQRDLHDELVLGVADQVALRLGQQDLVVEQPRVALARWLAVLDRRERALKDQPARDVDDVERLVRLDARVDLLQLVEALSVLHPVVDLGHDGLHLLHRALQIGVVGAAIVAVAQQLADEQWVLADTLDRLDEEALEREALALGLRGALLEKLGKRVLLHLTLEQLHGLGVVAAVLGVVREVVHRGQERAADALDHRPVRRVVHHTLELAQEELVHAEERLNVGEERLDVLGLEHLLLRHALHKHLDDQLQVLDVVQLGRVDLVCGLLEVLLLLRERVEQRRLFLRVLDAVEPVLDERLGRWRRHHNTVGGPGA
eukprot:Unigene14367_Nuclearia_a/m.43356 Unigene14367_Nuclearia_a/g.43356  ORF Unigene14367_Nuclearia_a/g.43356 Unigene14367_Nuclearia_a/m.43356 type:complete len:329 (-) Unigene14367_Nuclearia_a:823-1809(-)